MADDLSVIKKAINEHHSIRENLKLAGDSMTDIEALFVIDKAYAAWTQGSIRDFKEKQEQLLRAVSALYAGLKRHFEFEEKMLPPLLGAALMKSLLRAHRQIAREIEAVKNYLNKEVAEGLSQSELLARKTRIQEMVNNIKESVEEHARHEEDILKSIQKALEEVPVK